MKPDRLADVLLDLLDGVAGGHATGKIGHPRAVVAPVFSSFDEHHVFAHCSFLTICACLKMLRSVFGWMSSPSFPGIVTRPRFTGCLYCRWLPSREISFQPSSSTIRTISLTFFGALTFCPWNLTLGNCLLQLAAETCRRSNSSPLAQS